MIYPLSAGRPAYLANGQVKATKKDKKTYVYWMALWREGDRVRNIRLGCCAKMDKEVAIQKAKEMKAEALEMPRRQFYYFFLSLINVIELNRCIHTS